MGDIHDPGPDVRVREMVITSRERADDGSARITIAANDDVGIGPVVDLSGMSTKRYEANPVVMWAHDTTGRTPAGGIPVGRSTKFDRIKDGDQMSFAVDFEFLPDDPFAERVENAWDRGFLRAASISWQPLETELTDDGFRDVKSELLEWSIVAVPADKDALRTAARGMIDAFLDEPVPVVFSSPMTETDPPDHEELVIAVGKLAHRLGKAESRLAHLALESTPEADPEPPVDDESRTPELAAAISDLRNNLSGGANHAAD